MKWAIFDPGPLVAWLCPRDEHHAWARQAFRDIAPGSLVSGAVLTEACHLTAQQAVPHARFIEFVCRIRLTPVALSGDLDAIGQPLNRHTDTPMDFADACVLRLAELHPEATVCTTDTDSRFYRKCGQESNPLLAPFTA